MDNSVLEKFIAALENMGVVMSRQAINEIHNKLMWKIYIRCNEFLQAITKLSHIQQKKGVDASTGLRDKLIKGVRHRESFCFYWIVYLLLSY